MSMCSMGFDHPEAEPPVEVVQAPDTEPIADASVQIARINAERDIAIAKLEYRALQEEEAAQLAALAVENDTLRAQAVPAEPEPEEVPVMEVPAEPEPEPEPGTAPPVTEPTSTPEPARKRKSAWWS